MRASERGGLPVVGAVFSMSVSWLHFKVVTLIFRMCMGFSM